MPVLKKKKEQEIKIIFLHIYRFRQTMLEQGGACQPAVAFRRFRGRDPSPNALLRSLGLKPYKPPPPSQNNTSNK